MDKSLLHRPFFESPAFARYRDELAGWLESGSGEDALRGATHVVGRAIRASALQPEQLLAGLHAEAFVRETASSGVPETVRTARYASAVGRLMQACFGRASRLRVVVGNDGRVWTVMPIEEGARWDPEIEMRRRGWLCCVTTGDRRYISPVPRDWEEWTGMEIAGAIADARPDLRGA
jgi:hypothetical protein